MGSALSVAFFPGALPTRAQEDTSKPKPAARAFPPLIGGYGDQDVNNQEPPEGLQPDTRPLTGLQNATLGTPGIRHSYWVSGFQYGNSVRSTALNQATSSGWNSTSYLAGNVSVLEARSRAQLSINYSGGGSFSTDSTQGNTYFHQFGLVQSFDWRKWQLSFIDQFSYLPETQFGFGGATGLSIPGVGGSLGPSLPGLQNNYLPNQSIFTTIGPRYSNALASQVVYSVSTRGSMTVAGSFGILRFVEAGSIESNDAIFSVGYNYSLTREDTIGILYRFSGYRYIGNPQAINDHVAQFAYGRKITERLALQLFGGPGVSTYRVPVGNSTNKVSGSGGANLSYAVPRGNLSLTYYHSVSGGSGTFAGANTDQLQVGFSRQLSREWAGDLRFGYARNGSIASANLSQTYNSWYIGGGLSRPLGRNANFTLGYTAEIQTSNQSVCAAGTCGTSYTQHQISLGFQWHTRPFVIR